MKPAHVCAATLYKSGEVQSVR